MNLKTIMIAGLCAAALVTLLWLSLRSHDDAITPVPPPAPRAILTAPAGGVEFTPTAETTARVPAPPQPLADGDTVTTGPDGACVLTFQGNTIVRLGPDTSVVIGAQGAQGATLGAVLLAGSATLAGDAAGMGFTIGTPVGVVQLPKDKLAEVSIHFDGGVKVLAGEVSLTPPKSTLGQVVLSGQEITLDGLKVATAPAAVDGLTLDVPKAPPPSLPVSLQPRGGQVRRRPRGAQGWQRVRRMAQLADGDVVRVAPNASAHVTLDDTMHVDLGPKALFALRSTVGGDEVHSAKADLTSGPAEVAIDGADPKKRASVTVARGQVDIEPTIRAASVEMTPEGARTRVRVRFGAATLPGNTLVHAGDEAWLRDGAVVAGPKAAYADALPAALGTGTEIYYDAQKPPVRFTLSGNTGRGQLRPQEGNTGHQMQWSTDEHFGALEAAEIMTASTFARDRLPEGRSFFRTTDDTSAIGELVVRHDDSTVCADCRTSTVLEDVGEKVVVHYEHRMPQVRVTWNPLAAQSGASVLLFSDANLNTPIFRAPASGDGLQVPDELLKEGTYHWYVAPGSDVASDANTSDKTAQNAPAPARAINTFKIERDAVTDGLELTTPRRSQITKRRRLLSSGHVSRGAKLRLNGATVPVRDDGSFRVPVALTPGHNRLVFRVTEPQKNDKYYIRDVTLSH